MAVFFAIIIKIITTDRGQVAMLNNELGVPARFARRRAFRYNLARSEIE